jgi:hypothetical protein
MSERLLHFAFQPLKKVDVNCRLLTPTGQSDIGGGIHQIEAKTSWTQS